MENQKSFWEKRCERRIESGFHKFFCGFFHFLFGIAFGALLVAVVMWLWNWLLPAIFGIAEINFCQALGILALSKILFGGLCFGWHCGHKHKHHHNHFRDRWMKMSDEEREEFYKRRHFGHDFFEKKNDENFESK